jgi:hypothetical protein
MLGARVLLASGGGSASAETLPHRPRCMVSCHARLLGDVGFVPARPTSSETHLATERALGGARTNTFATIEDVGYVPTNHGGEDGMANDGVLPKAFAGGYAPPRSAAGSISPSCETRSPARHTSVGARTSDVGFVPTRSATRPGTSDVGFVPTRSATDGTSDVGFVPTKSVHSPAIYSRNRGRRRGCPHDRCTLSRHGPSAGHVDTTSRIAFGSTSVRWRRVLGHPYWLQRGTWFRS